MKKVLVMIDGTQRSLDALRATVLEGSGSIERIELANVQPLWSQHVARWIKHWRLATHRHTNHPSAR